VADLAGELRDFIEGLGYEFVDLKQVPGHRRMQLRVFIDVDTDEPGASVSHGDCIRVTREVGDFLEAHELVNGPYLLEVSSPGLGRPLTTARHFRRNTGRLCELHGKDAGGRPFELTGRISEVGEGSIWIEVSDTEAREIDLAQVTLARLVPDFRRPRAGGAESVGA
jgi:ribosome maturation factor RimP